MRIKIPENSHMDLILKNNRLKILLNFDLSKEGLPDLENLESFTSRKESKGKYGET